MLNAIIILTGKNKKDLVICIFFHVLRKSFKQKICVNEWINGVHFNNNSYNYIMKNITYFNNPSVFARRVGV